MMEEGENSPPPSGDPPSYEELLLEQEQAAAAEAAAAAAESSSAAPSGETCNEPKTATKPKVDPKMGPQVQLNIQPPSPPPTPPARGTLPPTGGRGVPGLPLGVLEEVITEPVNVQRLTPPPRTRREQVTLQVESVASALVQGERHGGGGAGGILRPPVMVTRSSWKPLTCLHQYLLHQQRLRYRREALKKARTKTLLWFLLPKLIILLYSLLLSIIGMEMTAKDIEYFRFHQEDIAMILYSGGVYLALQIGVHWRFDLRFQLMYHMYSTWMWGMLVFYLTLFPPGCYDPFAMLVMSATGSAIYGHVIILALGDRLDIANKRIFLVGLLVPVGVILLSQPTYLLSAWLRLGSLQGGILEYVRFTVNVFIGVIVATALCYERFFYSYRFINGPNHAALARDIDRLLRSYAATRRNAQERIANRA